MSFNKSGINRIMRFFYKIRKIKKSISNSPRRKKFYGDYLQQALQAPKRICEDEVDEKE